MTSNGYPEDVRMSNLRLLIGTTIIVIAPFAQFYNKKFPENRNFLIACIVLYPFRGLVFGMSLGFKKNGGQQFSNFGFLFFFSVKIYHDE